MEITAAALGSWGSRARQREDLRPEAASLRKVGLPDALSEHPKLRTNGTQIPQRRDKKIQQELVKAAGLRSPRQAGGMSISDVEEFLNTEQMPVVVKPVESAGQMASSCALRRKRQPSIFTCS